MCVNPAQLLQQTCYRGRANCVMSHSHSHYSHSSPPYPSSLQVVRTTGLRALHGLFYSVAGPQGLTAQLNGQLISVSTTASLTPLSSHSSRPLPIYFSLYLSIPPPPHFFLRLLPSPSLSLLLSPPPLSLSLPPSFSYLLPLLPYDLSSSRLSMTTSLVWLTPKCCKYG